MLPEVAQLADRSLCNVAKRAIAAANETENRAFGQLVASVFQKWGEYLHCRLNQPKNDSIVCLRKTFAQEGPLRRMGDEEKKSNDSSQLGRAAGVAEQDGFRCLSWGQPMTEDHWQELYFDVVHETDNLRLEQKIIRTESALQERLTEIDPKKDPEEYPLLRRAIESVKRLRAEKLMPGK